MIFLPKNNNKRYLFVTLITTIAIFFPSAGFAHHVISETGLTSVEPTSSIDAEFSFAHFNFSEREVGYWENLAITLQYALAHPVSLSARINWAFVHYQDGRKALGIGDLEVGCLFNLYSSKHGGFIVSLGVGTEWPTGDVPTGIGNGHVEIDPYVILSTAPLDNLFFTGVITFRQSFDNEEKTSTNDPFNPNDTTRFSHGSVLGPHSPQELVLQLDAAYILHEKYYASLGMQWVEMFGTEIPGPLTIKGQIGYQFAKGWNVSVGAEGPVYGEKRNDFKVMSGIRWRF